MPAPLEFLYTTDCGPGQRSPQPIPSESIGGFASSTAWSGGVQGDLFGMSSSHDIFQARSDFRCLYVYNPSTVDTLSDVRLFMEPATAGAGYCEIGIDPRPVTAVDSTAAQAVEPGSTYNPPPGVTFASPLDYASGLVIGTLPPRTGRAIWFKRVSVESIDAAAEAVDLIVSDGVLASVLRRVTWMTEPASAPTAPYRSDVYTATPTPIQRVMVDFLTMGFARVTWAIDRTMTDRGPYHFQLQVSQSGTTSSDDWANVGPPVQDAFFLIDPKRRLWGMTPTVHYRVVLTTGANTYVSASASVYGLLNKEEWLTVREVFRKEDLMHRRFTGINGFLLKAKRYGTVCPLCVDPVTREIGNSSCPTCYGTGISSGYQPAVPFTVIDRANESYKEQVAYNESRGTVAEKLTLVGRALAHYPIVSRDAWVAAGSDARYYIHRTDTIASRMGVPIVYNVELRQAPRGDILYEVPINRPADDPPYWQVAEILTI